MHTTEQLNTALSGRYEIERQVGQGGMAAVYLARDLKHNRKVALKVLSAELAAVLGRERFLSEIEVTANLQHPHLLPLFDSGEANGLLFYVMPYIEGETLRKRLERERQLTIEDAVHIAAAIGSALDYAHRQGVIHRDLKPENILLHEHEPLVMDFGIALAVSNAGGARVTQSGISLGTPQYMSPEQATGDRQIDGRSDVYSLGVVLYEMLSGDPPHVGTTVQGVIAKVLTDRPQSIRATRDTVPDYIEAALMRALAKLPADRFATAAEFVEAITGAKPVMLPGGVVLSAGPVHDGPPPDRSLQAASLEAKRAVRAAQRKRFVRTAVLGAIGITASAGAGVAVAPMFQHETTKEQVRFIVDLPDSLQLGGNRLRQVALSRDGSRAVLYFGGASRLLYSRRTGELVFDAIPGTDLARSMVMSPSGRHLLYWLQSGQLMKIAVEGGASVKIADSATAISEASWSDADQVLFRRRDHLVLVASDGGGRERVVARPDTSRRQIALGWPEMLPGGQAALITIERQGMGGGGGRGRGGGVITGDSSYLGVVSITDGTVTDLGIRGLTPHYASGHLLYVDQDGQLFAVPFDAGKGRVTGAPRVIAKDVWIRYAGVTDFAVAETGMILFTDGGPAFRPTFGPAGRGNARTIIIKDRLKEEVLKVPPRQYVDVRASPDGEMFAVTIQDSTDARKEDVWLLHRTTGQWVRITRNGMSSRPVWSPDGKRLIYRVTDVSQKPVIHFVSEPWDQSEPPKTVVGADGAEDIEFAPGGGYVAYVRGDSLAAGGRTIDSHIFIAPADSLQVQRPLAATALRERMPRFSPNGKWLAYVGHELSTRAGTQAAEGGVLWVRPVPGPGAATPISITTGNTPMWSRDSRTLYYFSGGNAAPLVAAHLSDTKGLEVVKRDTVFRRAPPGTAFGQSDARSVADILPDASIVYLSFERAPSEPSRVFHSNLVAIVNWLGGAGTTRVAAPPR
jgi:serine/threonine-protein kinase